MKGLDGSNPPLSASESSMLVNTRDVHCFGTKARARGRILTAKITPIKHRHSIEGRNRARPIAVGSDPSLPGGMPSQSRTPTDQTESSAVRLTIFFTQPSQGVDDDSRGSL